MRPPRKCPPPVTLATTHLSPIPKMLSLPKRCIRRLLFSVTCLRWYVLTRRLSGVTRILKLPRLAGGQVDMPPATLFSRQLHSEVTRVPQFPRLVSGGENPRPQAELRGLEQAGHARPASGTWPLRSFMTSHAVATAAANHICPEARREGGGGPAPPAADWRRRRIARSHRPMGTWSRGRARGKPSSLHPSEHPFSRWLPLNKIKKKERKARPGTHSLPLPEAPTLASAHQREANDFIS